MNTTNPEVPTTSAWKRWENQCAEWQAIGDELMAAAGKGVPVTAYQVTLEQRKRMLARGERPVTYAEIVASAEANPHAGLG